MCFLAWSVYLCLWYVCGVCVLGVCGVRFVFIGCDVRMVGVWFVLVCDVCFLACVLCVVLRSVYVGGLCVWCACVCYVCEVCVCCVYVVVCV